MKRIALAILLVACSKADPQGTAPEPPPSAPVSLATASVASSGLPVAAPAPLAPATALTAFVATRAKLVGHTSLVIRLENEAKQRVIFRAAFREGGTRYRGEIAAYRLAKHLGLAALFAEATPHSMRADKLRELLPEGDRAKFVQSALVDEHGFVSGALVRWIDGLEMPAFEREPWLSKWKGWIQNGADVPAADRPLAAQFSTLVVFDYLTGNFDRWSGGNVGAVRRGDSLELRFIDNDGAFLDPMPKGPLAASKERLLASKRFARGFVEKLQALAEEPSWDAALGTGADGKPLLSHAVAEGVRARALEALKHVEASGDSALAFP